LNRNPEVAWEDEMPESIMPEYGGDR
jgi:hypothetical protein